MGAFTTHIDDIPGFGEPKIRDFSAQRFGESELQESPPVHVGAESAHESESSLTLTQDAVAENLKPLPTPLRSRAVQERTLAIADIKLRHCKLSELCWLATVSRPGIRARLARIA